MVGEKSWESIGIIGMEFGSVSPNHFRLFLPWLSEQATLWFGSREPTFLRSNVIGILWSQWCDSCHLQITRLKFRKADWLAQDHTGWTQLCPEWFQELVKTGYPNPPGRTLCPALLVVFIHSPKVTETKNITEQRERWGQGSDLYFQFSLAGSCSQGCWANTWLLRFSCKGSSWWPSEPWRFGCGWSAASGWWAHMSQKGWLSTLNLVVR